MQFGMRLVDVANFNRDTTLELATVGLQLVHDHLKDGRFTCTIGANYAYNSRRGQIKIQVLVE